MKSSIEYNRISSTNMSIGTSAGPNKKTDNLNKDIIRQNSIRVMK